MRSSTLTIFPILALSALASAGPLPIQADSVSAPMSDINTAAAPGLMKRDFESSAEHAWKDAVDAADSVYAGTWRRDV